MSTHQPSTTVQCAQEDVAEARSQLTAAAVAWDESCRGIDELADLLWAADAYARADRAERNAHARAERAAQPPPLPSGST